MLGVSASKTDNPRATLLQLRNCLQQCPLNNGQRDGPGIIISDDGDTLMGQWHQGKLNGWYIYLTENSQAYGFMSGGNLHGFNVVQINENLTVCGYFHKNMAHGTCLVTTADKFQVTRFKHGYREDIIEKGSYNRHTVYQLISRLFNGEIIGLRKFMAFQLEQTGCVHGSLAEIQINSVYRYYGFVNSDATQGQGLGIVFKNDVLYNYGTYKATELCGLGRLYIKEEIHDGIFFEGVLRGEGIKYDYTSNQYSCGMHTDNNLDFEKGYGFPTQLIRRIHKSHHLRSVDFQNDVVVMDRLVRIKIGDIMPQYKQDKEQVASTYTSIRRKIEKTPSQKTTGSAKHSRLYVADNSPLKRMLKEYEKEVDNRIPPKTRYENDRQSNKSKSPSRARPKTNSVYGSDDEEFQKTRKTEQPRSNQIYHREDPRMDNDDSLVVKDTFSMIKHMEEVERGRRQQIDRLQRTRNAGGNRR